MAGRGRGRGRGSMSFDISALGFGRGELVPAATLQPPPAFPPLEFKPSPLSNTEVDEYLLALKQEFKGAMRDSPYYIKANQRKRDIARYSDKYKEAQKSTEYIPDKRLFPKELIETTAKKRKIKAVVKPNIPVKKISSEKIKKPDDANTLQILEKIIEEKVVDDNEDVKEGDEVEEEEEYYEEEEEEDNDYLVNYYDEGDDDIGMEDDNDGDEGPVY